MFLPEGFTPASQEQQVSVTFPSPLPHSPPFSTPLCPESLLCSLGTHSRSCHGSVREKQSANIRERSTFITSVFDITQAAFLSSYFGVCSPGLNGEQKRRPVEFWESGSVWLRPGGQERWKLSMVLKAVFFPAQPRALYLPLLFSRHLFLCLIPLKLLILDLCLLLYPTVTFENWLDDFDNKNILQINIQPFSNSDTWCTV